MAPYLDLKLCGLHTKNWKGLLKIAGKTKMIYSKLFQYLLIMSRNGMQKPLETFFRKKKNTSKAIRRPPKFSTLPNQLLLATTRNQTYK